MRMLLVHGLGDDRTAWDLVIEGLGQFGDPMAVTLPGFGGTSFRPGARAEDLAGLVWDLSPTTDGPVILIGHSAGGVIASLMAEMQPTRVAALINVEGNLTSSDCTFSAAAVAADPFQPWFSRFVAEQSPRYQSALNRCDPAAFTSLAADLVRLSSADLAARYMDLGVPKLFCWGGGYSMPSRKALLDAGETVEDFGTAGHWLMEDLPQPFNDAIGRFLATLS